MTLFRLLQGAPGAKRCHVDGLFFGGVTLWDERAHFLFGRLIMDLGSSPRVTTGGWFTRVGWAEMACPGGMVPKCICGEAIAAAISPVRTGTQANGFTGVQRLEMHRRNHRSSYSGLTRVSMTLFLLPQGARGAKSCHVDRPFFGGS